MNIMIATVKSWNIDKARKLQAHYKNQHTIKILTHKDELSREKIETFNPDYIFFPHWSWMIPKDIHMNYFCVVFHMTDLPFGRGGSPLQNLIVKGIENTKITAIKVTEGLDTGDIFLKKDLNLNGSAEEIYIRAAQIIFQDMIPEIIETEPIPYQQTGDISEFQRRTREDGEIKQDFSLEKFFDYIRMLDAEGYPRAFIQYGNFRLEFSRPSLKNGKIIADVEIMREV